MHGDRLLIGPEHRAAAKTLADRLGPILVGRDAPFVVAIGGESGSGKSETAAALADALSERSVQALIIQQDDYFEYPPKTNARRRREAIDRVGPREVRLDLLDRHLKQLVAGVQSIEKPLVFYDEDRIGSETVSAEGVRVILVEGTYTPLLPHVDWRVFIDRTYVQTRNARLGRGREKQDEFLDRVLRIEHEIIAPQKKDADILVTSDYSIRER